MEAGDRLFAPSQFFRYSLLPIRYSHYPKRHPLNMRAEIEQLSEAIKQSVGLLRRHL